MHAIRIRRTLESETLPELRPLLGRPVEIIVLDVGEAGSSHAPAGNACGTPAIETAATFFGRADRPLTPQAEAESREELRRRSLADERLAAILRAADEPEGYDVEAVLRGRRLS